MRVVGAAFSRSLHRIFFCKDGYGDVVDENGGSGPLDYVADQNEFVIKTVATHSE
ncbi:hypothetical protein BD408DRAFT_392632 [Parasitella parasitica]|nr:hypothetical protein BD408DRAFT_392632 [Parasitella parasitica]